MDLRNLLDFFLCHFWTFNLPGPWRSRKIILEGIFNFGFHLRGIICELKDLSKVVVSQAFKEAMHRVNYQHTGRIPVWKAPKLCPTYTMGCKKIVLLPTSCRIFPCLCICS